MIRNIFSASMVMGLMASVAFGQAAQVPQAAVPADGITVDMMPITQDQLTSCRQQASSQLTDEQKTLHDREHGQDKDKMAQGAITGTTGAVTSAVSRGRGWGGWWGGGNNNGANTAAATGATQRTDRNSDNVASTTATSQQVGVDAYQQCVLGIKGSEYVQYRAGHPLNGVPAATPVSAPATVASAAGPPPPSSSPVQDEGDGKHFVLTEPGQSSSVEVTQAPGSKNAYIDASTGTKYIVMPDGSVKKIARVTRKS
jgi:hypothetical protein